MSTLIALHSFVTPVSVRNGTNNITTLFSRINRWGILTIIALGFAMISVVCYIGSVYYMFSLGVQIHRDIRLMKELEEHNIAVELRINQQETAFARVHADVLQSMQNISSMRYLMTDSVAVSTHHLIQ